MESKHSNEMEISASNSGVRVPIEGKEQIRLGEIWSDLEDAISQIFKSEQSLTIPRYMRLYTHVYNYCTTGSAGTELPTTGIHKDGIWSMGETLYEKLRQLLQNYVNNLFTSFESGGYDLLTQFAAKWTRYQRSSTVLNNICASLNYYWVKRQRFYARKGVYEVYHLALVIWRDKLFCFLKEPLTKSLLQSIEDERLGIKINRSVIRSAINCFIALGINEDESDSGVLGLSIYKDFERKFLVATALFYDKSCNAFLAVNSITDYIRYVEQCLEEERKRVMHSGLDSVLTPYLHCSTLDVLISTCETVLIQTHINVFLGEFQNLLKTDKEADFNRTYTLILRTPANLIEMLKILEQHILQQGLEAIESSGNIDSYDPKDYVQAVLELYRKFEALNVTVLNKDEGFIAALDRACGKFIKSAELSK